MYIPEEKVNKANDELLKTVISKYKSLDYSNRKNYEKLCEEYRNAVDNKDPQLSQELYKLMQDIQRRKSVDNRITSPPNRRTFWNYIKHIGRKKIFSVEDISKRLSISIEQTHQLIDDAVLFRLIYKDGPTTYRMRNPKRIAGNDVSSYLNGGKTNPQKRDNSVSSANKYQNKIQKNYAKLLKAARKSSKEIQEGIDRLNNERESLAVRRKGNEMARKRNSGKTNWKKDARKMQNNQPKVKYKTLSGSRSTKKEYIDPDEKDKKKIRDLQLGEAKNFIDFYGLDG